jgi:hypothetical protein
LGSVCANRVFAVLAMLLGVAVVSPLEILEVLGTPPAVASSCFGGRRGGALIALWVTLIAAAVFLILRPGDVEGYVITVVGYLAIGAFVGIVMDRFAASAARARDAGVRTSRHRRRRVRTRR